jgi:hypothetical protein
MFAPVEVHLSGGDLLRAWWWLVPRSAQVLRITACGDVFYTGDAGAVWFLDTAHGSVEQVASSAAQLDALFDVAANRQRFLWSFVVRAMYTDGKQLASNQCYSPKHPIHLGGTMETANLEPTDVRIHLEILGQLHQQTRHLALGTRIRDVRVERADPTDRAP